MPHQFPLSVGVESAAWYLLPTQHRAVGPQFEEVDGVGFQVLDDRRCMFWLEVVVVAAFLVLTWRGDLDVELVMKFLGSGR